jgi:hypothetical protein
MFSTKELDTLKLLVTKEIALINAEFNKIEIVNDEHKDIGYINKRYFEVLQEIQSKL